MSSHEHQKVQASIEGQRRSELIKLIDNMGLDEDETLPQGLFNSWRKEMKETFGLGEENVSNSVLTNSTNYLLLKRDLEDLDFELRHRPRQMNAVKWSKEEQALYILPRWTVRGIRDHFELTLERIAWVKKLSLRFVEVLYEGMKKGIDEEVMESWRRDAKRIFLTGIRFGPNPVTDYIRIAAATKFEEYNDTMSEIAQLLWKIEYRKDEVYRAGSSSLVVHWHPREMEDRIEAAQESRLSRSRSRSKSPERNSPKSVFHPSER